MKKLLEGSKKKVAGIAIAGTLVVGSIGGTTYAYKDEWTAKIVRGVDMLAGYIYKDDVNKAVDAHGNSLENQLRKDIQDMIASITSTLQAHKQNEIDRGKQELDTKYHEDKNRAQEVINDAVAAEKAEQTAKTDAEVQSEKNDMDAVIEAELDKIPE